MKKKKTKAVSRQRGNDGVDLKAIREHYTTALKKYGTNPQGVGWKSDQRQTARFVQLAKCFEDEREFSLVDIGCGYGAFYDYCISAGRKLDYLGVDISPEMIEEAKSLHPDDPRCRFKVGSVPARRFDCVVASGIFNVMRAGSHNAWEEYVFNQMRAMFACARKAMACNFLTTHHDAARTARGLYYADPAKILNFCVTELSLDVALYHHYGTWDFTVCIAR